ncbi:MAG: ATP-grasp domain-containing protein [Inquilinus sp.]|uniref:carboxylate--amine ligase n=1 Tax=Inquilinus sp. TaxID=1932117 RepID=UPI003F356860
MTAREACAESEARDGRGPPGAVVVGGDYIALGVVRSLGRHGVPVWVMHDGLHVCAAASRFALRRLPWPVDEAGRLASLRELSTRNGLRDWVLYPTDDESAALVARNHEALSGSFRLTTPPWAVLQWAYDKRLTYGLASRLGIDHPWTLYPQSCEEVAALDCTFPAILKPAVKAQSNRFTRARAWRVDDHRQLLARYAEACELIDPSLIMIQEFIAGGGEAQYSFAALCADGRPLAWLVARRARQHPVDFGGHGSSFVETVDEPEIEEAAHRLLAAIGYNGLVEVEFKRDSRSGRPKLLDINARTWGWHTLGGAAGTDFPYLSWRLAQGAIIPTTRARAGVRWVRAATDVPAAMGELKRGRLSIGEYVRSLRPPIERAVFALDDPLPAFADVPWLLYRRWRRAWDGTIFLRTLGLGDVTRRN